MKPFPWRCRTCREVAVNRVTEPYTTTVEHDGRSYLVDLPKLEVLRCQRCGAIVLDDAANIEITKAFRQKAGLLDPVEIRRKREALDLTQKQLATYLDVSESTLSRWETGTQIQQRAMNKLLCSFFEVQALREYLGYKETPKIVKPSRTTAGPRSKVIQVRDNGLSLSDTTMISCSAQSSMICPVKG